MAIEDLFGNKRIKHILTRYLKNEIIPSAIIFSGHTSANKLNFALGFAKALNCLDRMDDFCDECRSCQEINKDIFPDVKMLAPDGQFFKKEQITFIVEDNYMKPLKGRKKVYILNDAHRMNENSANAFLKVLEEPAAANVLILLTNNLNGLLPTIRSRCQILEFTSPSKSEIREYLIEQGYSSDDAHLISYLSQSVVGEYSRNNLTEIMTRRLNSLTILTKLIMNRDVEDVLLDLNSRSRSRESFLTYFNELVNLISLLLRDIMLLKIDSESDTIINIDYREKLLKLSEYITSEKVLFLLKRMELLMRDIKRNLNTRVLILEFIKNFTVKGLEDV